MQVVGEKTSSMVVLLFQGTETFVSSRRTCNFGAERGELPDCCHLTGQPDELVHPLNLHTALTVYLISQALCNNSYSRRDHGSSVSCLLAGAEFYY